MHTLEQLRSGALAGCRRLDLNAGLTTLPPEIFTLADTLEVLNLSGNQLSRLPDELPRLRRLKVIFASDNPFTELPAVLGRCEQLEMVGFKACQIDHVPAEALPPQLRWLILTDNRIASLPAELGRRPRLQKLMLAGNRLRALPDLSGCTQLELLRLAANRFEALPAWLPTLPRLAWLALAGNPLWSDQAGTHDRPDIARIRWSDLQLAHRLGEGASGVIHRAAWRPASAATPHPVAVKLFRAAMTSDGLPDCEMAACIAAAGHAGLIEVEGVLQGHPDGAAGLVLALLDARFRALAGPPSLASCTRDVYASGLRLPVASVLRIARTVADVAAHLHAQGLMHGDLYAHNLLWNGAAALPDCVLSDFGAASFYDRADPAASALQRIEVRAFGCLLEELIERAEGLTPADAACVSALAALRDDCLQAEVQTRPDFAQVVQALEQIGA
ncbi:MAG: leucine-rich repeat-containing protein kinase family protein [Leptothrix sp. (in: b-proteobacteria)]